MKYMGSKNRYAKYILPIILKDRQPDQWYVEPFVGGANAIDKVTGKRLGSDINTYTIQALQAIRDRVTELPKTDHEFTERDYKELRKSNNYRFKGYAGFAFSYAAKWLGGWCRGWYRNRKRDYVNEAYRNAVKQSPNLKGILLVCMPYHELIIPPSSIIYCDPPYYQSSTRYKDELDYPEFWQWCRDMTIQGHRVFISEYDAPEDFEVVWQQAVYKSLDFDTGSEIGVEKLFHKGD